MMIRNRKIVICGVLVLLLCTCFAGSAYAANIDISQGSGGGEFKNGVLNIANDLAILVGAIAACMVVYASVQYSLSFGNPSKAEKAKKTIIYAAIGLAAGAMGGVLLGVAQEVGGVNDINGVAGLINSVRGGLTVIASAAAALAVGYGGLLMITSSGNPQKVQTGKKSIIGGIIGILIIVLANVLTGIVYILLNSSFSGSASVQTMSYTKDENGDYVISGASDISSVEQNEDHSVSVVTAYQNQCKDGETGDCEMVPVTDSYSKFVDEAVGKGQDLYSLSEDECKSSIVLQVYKDNQLYQERPYRCSGLDRLNSDVIDIDSVRVDGYHRDRVEVTYTDSDGNSVESVDGVEDNLSTGEFHYHKGVKTVVKMYYVGGQKICTLKVRSATNDRIVSESTKKIDCAGGEQNVGIRGYLSELKPVGTSNKLQRVTFNSNNIEGLSISGGELVDDVEVTVKANESNELVAYYTTPLALTINKYIDNIHIGLDKITGEKGEKVGDKIENWINVVIRGQGDNIELDKDKTDPSSYEGLELNDETSKKPLNVYFKTRNDCAVDVVEYNKVGSDGTNTYELRKNNNTSGDIYWTAETNSDGKIVAKNVKEKVGQYELSEDGKSLKFQGKDSNVDFSKIFSSNRDTKGKFKCTWLSLKDIVGSDEVIPVMRSMDSGIKLNSNERKSIVLIRKEKTNE